MIPGFRAGTPRDWYACACDLLRFACGLALCGDLALLFVSLLIQPAINRAALAGLLP